MTNATLETTQRDGRIGGMAGRDALARSNTRFWRQFRRHRLAISSLCFLALATLAAIFAPLVAGSDPEAINPLVMMRGPSWEHPLGTDQVGRDVWARLIFGARVSLSVGIVSVAIAAAIAVVIGGLSGYYGGAIDMLLMRFTDVMMTFPTLMLIMAVVATLGPGLFNIMAVIGIFGWTGMARLLRGQILSVRERDFIVAARCVGVTDRRIIFQHVLPNAVGPLLVSATLSIAAAIMTEAGLSFLGLGVLPPTPTWGNMLNGAQSFSILEQNWWLWLPPGLAILLTTLAINYVGDALSEAIDPRMSRGGS
jgi:peptide/nickel transport system permease protein